MGKSCKNLDLKNVTIYCTCYSDHLLSHELACQAKNVCWTAVRTPVDLHLMLIPGFHKKGKLLIQGLKKKMV